MESIRPDHIGILTISGRGLSSTRTDVNVRNLRLTLDEPPERGGADLGPTPPEALLAALIGCTNRISHKIAEANGVEIQHMTVELEAAFDRKGVNLEEEINVPLPAIELKIEITTNAIDSSIEKLKTDLRKFCPISKIIRQSGTQITEVWSVRRP